MKIIQRSNSAIKRFLLILLLIVISSVSYYVWQSKNQTSSILDNASETSQSQNKTNYLGGVVFDSKNCPDGYRTEVTSGKSSFSICIADGWGPIQRVAGSDELWLVGLKQQETQVGKPVKVLEAAHGPLEGGALFAVFIEASSKAPQGHPTKFGFGKDENALQGMRYVYEYPRDTPAGYMDSDRIKGDRDYVYVFDLGNRKQLRVWYSIYAVDPRNNIQTIDAMVRTIRINK